MSELPKELACYRCGGSGLEYKRHLGSREIISSTETIKALREDGERLAKLLQPFHFDPSLPEETACEYDYENRCKEAVETHEALIKKLDEK